MDPAVDAAYPDSPDTEVIPVTPAGMRPNCRIWPWSTDAGRVPPSHIGSDRLRTDQRSPAPGPPPDDDRRACHRRRDRGAGACSHRRGVAVAVGEEQHAQPGLRARSRFPRHPRPERTVRRRELPDRRRGQPHRREQRHGGGHHRRRCRRKVGHRDAGEHPREPGTRCGRVLSARPGHRADGVRAVESRDRRIRPDHRPRVTDVRGRRGVHRVQAELRVRRRWTQVPGQGRFRNCPACP